MGFRALTAAVTAFAAFSVLALGCTATASVSATPAGCSPDDSLNCSAGGNGWTCAQNDNPEDEVSNLSCSVPRADGSNDDFCCISFTSSSCHPDNDVTSSCQYPSYGYSCAQNDDPTSFDSSLNCSTPTADGANDDFCCE